MACRRTTPTRRQWSSSAPACSTQTVSRGGSGGEGRELCAAAALLLFPSPALLQHTPCLRSCLLPARLQSHSSSSVSLLCSLRGRRHLPGHPAEPVEPHLRCVGHPHIHPGALLGCSPSMQTPVKGCAHIMPDAWWLGMCQLLRRLLCHVPAIEPIWWAPLHNHSANNVGVLSAVAYATPLLAVAAVGSQPQLASKLRGALHCTACVAACPGCVTRQRSQQLCKSGFWRLGFTAFWLAL